MADAYLQDFIRECMAQDRAGFARKLGAPVLIAQSPRRATGFARGGTTLKRDIRKTGLARRDVLKMHELPVLVLHQRRPGPSGRVEVGRDRANDLAIEDKTVSARHAVFARNPTTGTYTLQDMSSTNGTWVNGRQLVPGRAISLFDGDTLFFGDRGYTFYSPEGLFDALAANLERG